MTDAQAALEAARKHAQAIAAHLKRARNAHANGDDAELQRCHRAAAASCGALDDAHDSLERALEPDDDGSYIEPTHGPQAGSQVDQSHSGPPRSYTAEERRQRDQLAGCRAGYDAKRRAMGLKR